MRPSSSPIFVEATFVEDVVEFVLPSYVFVRQLGYCVGLYAFTRTSAHCQSGTS